jgi:hypothetical protein
VTSVAACLLLVVSSGCGSAAPRKAPGAPPTPQSVTVAEPGGDAHDPHLSAIERMTVAPWGRRGDKDDQLNVPLPDWEYWKRVRYWGVEHFVGFRYGKDHHALAVGLVQDMPPDTHLTSAVCMRHFETWARPQIKGYDVKLQPMGVKHSRWREQPLEVHYVDGLVNLGFTTTQFSGAWAAYPAYPNACLIYAIAVPWRDHEQQAKKLRDRFVAEAFEQIEPLTTERPYRK